jgi:deoxyadenosine/deoxycytidine kinase
MRIAIEGLSGLGKSTVLKVFESRRQDVFYEPVDQWTFLRGLYERPKAYATAFETQVLLSYCESPESQRGPPTGLMFQERSTTSALQVFARMLSSRGSIEPEALQALDTLERHLPIPRPDVYVYLRLDPGECLRRIEKRNRLSERSSGSTLTLDYLEDLQKAYDAWALRDARVRILDIDMDHGPEAIAEAILAELAL